MEASRTWLVYGFYRFEQPACTSRTSTDQPIRVSITWCRFELLGVIMCSYVSYGHRLTHMVVTEQLLGRVREHYSIPANYELHVLRPGQHAYDMFSNGFGLTLDALKVGLWFPLHLVIEDYHAWW
ncbi:hypothetical protein BHM03_00042913 [Ensete ventricosum]|nr:hypothetical protein BHM03_00042913 [Ensete ventricosum]